MKKYKIEVDFANCAAKMEEATKKVSGVRDATVAFMAQKMSVEFEDGVDEAKVMKDVLKACRKFIISPVISKNYNSHINDIFYLSSI